MNVNTGCNVPSKVTQVSEQIIGIDQNLGEMEESIKKLEDSLQGVLRIEVHKDSEEQKQKLPELTPLGDKLREIRIRINNHSSLIANIRERIEL